MKHAIYRQRFEVLAVVAVWVGVWSAGSG